MSEYDLGAIKAPLKLKSSKKKRKSTKYEEDAGNEEGKQLEYVNNELEGLAASKAVKVTRLTASEERFKRIQDKRKKEKIEKFISKSHKEKVQEFNERLDKLPEHNDMPKVGPG
ncbi:Protein FAM32A-like [Smittium culicis]|uniref:Protein FAM32A-like n=1 Tax=Smittium culicis TaxID=133412 RepID=A0A1R1YDK8_9FUNG|nr:Protein FAM32A-like [Smittium culicis]